MFIYGPFKVNGEHTTESNAQFDASLRARNPSWGYRDTAQVIDEAQKQGLTHVETVAMPANNFMLIFKR